MADDKKETPIVESEWVEPTVETEWVEPASPKSNAPSPNGGGSGAQVSPSTSTSTSSDLNLGSWTTEANPLKKEAKIEVPLAKGQPMPIQEAPSDIKLFEGGKTIRQEPKKTKLGTVAFDLNEVKRNVAENPIKPVPLTSDQRFNEVKNLEKRTIAVDSLLSGQSKIFEAKKAKLGEVEASLNNIKAQVEKAKAEGNIEGANQLIESAQPLIQQYDTQARELNKQFLKLDYLDKRKKNIESDMVGISEGQEYVTNQWQALNAGISSLAASVFRSPSFVYNSMISLVNKVAKETGLPATASPQTDGYLQQVAQIYQDNADAYNKVIEKKKEQADYSIQNLMNSGDYNKAFNLLSESIMESAPTTAAIAIGGMGGMTTAQTILGGAAVFGNQTFEENKKKGIDDNTNYINSWVNGALEGIFESTGTLQIVKHGADLFKKEGAKAVEETAKTLWEQVYGKVAKKIFPATSAVLEGVSEAETSFTQNYVNMATGVDKDYVSKYSEIANSDMPELQKSDALSELTKQHLFQGVPDAFYVGAATGAGMGAMQAKQGYTAVNDKKRNEIKKAQETLDNLNKTLINPLVSSEAKDIIQAKADAEAEKIALLAEQDDKDLRESLTKDEYEAVTNIQVKIETLEKSLDAIEDKDSKGLIEQQIKELEAEKKVFLDKSIDNIVSRVQEKRKELGVEFNIFEDLPKSIVSTFDRIEGNLPTDINSVQEASDYLYGKYKELKAMKSSKTRPLTTPQIDAFMEQLDEDITMLENYKTEQRKSAESTLKKNTSPTNEKYGTVNRNDGKGVVDLTKEEYLKEQGLATPEAEAGVTINTETDGKERREEEAKDVLTLTEEVKGVVEAAPLIEVSETTNEQTNESNIQQQVDKSEGNIGAVGDVAKEGEAVDLKAAFKAAGEQSKQEQTPKALGNFIIDNSNIGDRIYLNENEYYEVVRKSTNKKGNTETELQHFYKNEETGEFENNPSAVKLFNDKYRGTEQEKLGYKAASDLFENSYTNNKGEKVIEQSTYVPNETKNTKVTADAGQVQAKLADSEVAKDDTKGEVSEITPKDKVWSKAKAYNNLSKTERKSAYGSKLRSEIMSEAVALNYTVKPTKQGKYVLVDEKGKEIRNVGTPRSKDVIQEEKRIKERRSRARRELPISVKHSVAQDIANGVQFDRESLMKVSGLRDNEIPFWMTRTDGKGETLEFYSQKYQEKGGAYVEDDMDFQSQVADAIGEFAHKQGRTSALEYIETIQEKLENGGLTDAEMKEQAAEYQAELDEANFDYYAEYLSELSNEEAQELADQLREAEKQENQLIINEILNENGKENNREAGQGKQKVDTKAPNVKGKSETITALEKELSDIDNQIAKKQSQLNKLTKDQQSDMFGGAKVEMFDNSELLKELTNDIKDLKQKRNEKSAELEKQLEKESIVIQPENQLKIEEVEVKQEKELNKPKSAKEVATIFIKLFNFSPKESVWAARLFDAKATFMAKVKGISKEDYYKEYWFEGGSESQKGNWTKEAAKMKRIISMYEKADSTTAVHEMLGHDYLDRIIEASATNKEFEADLRTIAEEYVKAKGGKVEDVIKALKDFDVETNKSPKGTSVHEWFSQTAEQYFATERDVKRETPQQSKMAKIFEAFRQHLADLYDSMNKALIAPSEPMKKVFRKVFGEENFNQAEEIRTENIEVINNLNAAALEKNKKQGGLKSLAEKLKEKGLGQSEYAQDIWDAASELIADKKAKRYNVTDMLKEMFPAIENDIEEMRKVLQTIGTKGELRQGAENILANPNISDAIKEKVSKLSEYTPETLNQVGLSTAEVLDYYIGEYGEVLGLEKIKSLLEKGEFDGYTEKVAIQQSLIGMYNKLAKFGATAKIREDALNDAVNVAESYAVQGTGLGRMINAYKLLGALTTEGRIVWAQRQTKKYVKPAYEALKEDIKNLKAELKDAYKQVDYFFEQTLGREETEGQYNELIARYQAEIDALKARKAREPKPSKPAYKGVKVNRSFKESDLANFAKDILEGGLFQDMESMTAPQKLAYGIMEKKPINIVEFAKAFSKYLGKKIDPKEVEGLYKQTRDLLIEKDLAFADGLSTNEQLAADLEGLEVASKARIEELERKKAEAQAKKAAKAKKSAPKEHSEELADFVVNDVKKVIKGTIPKQKTYLDEILKALKEKVGDVVKKGEKEKVQTAKVSEVEAIKFALDAINNGGADANMWNEAVEQVKAKIKGDNDLSQQDKDDLNLYLNDYTTFLYDNLLSDNKIFKAIKEKLIQSGYGSGNIVNWKKIITGADGDVTLMRENVKELVREQLSGYDDVQVEKVLDAIVYRYDQEINKKRKEIADKYVENQLKDRRSTKKKTASVQGKIGKLLVEDRLGLMEEGNEAILNELAVAKGLKIMSAADWKTARQLAENVENSVDGNLKNEAIEELTAFIASKQPLSWMDTASAIRFAGLLGRPLTILKNLIGNTIEGGLLAGGRTLRGDFSFIKESFKGANKGGFNDILLGGGINQSSKTSVEVNNTGMPYFRALEYGKRNKFIASGKVVSRILDATDSVYQEMFSTAYDRVYLEKYFKFQNPTATKAEINQMVNETLDKTKFDEFYYQALQDVIKSGKKPTPANVKRRTYEILRESQISQVVRDMADLESTEKTFKSEFDDNKGLATIIGKYIAKGAQLSKDLVKPYIKAIIKKTTKAENYNEKRAEAISEKISQLVPNYLMPFTRGVSNIIEKGLEKEMVYGLTKSLITKWGINKMPTTTIEEKMLKARAEEKVKDLASTAIFTGLITYGIGAAIALATKGGDDDEEDLKLKGIDLDKSSVSSNSSAKERAEQENTLTIMGHKIPLSLLGSAGIALGVDVNIYEALTAKPDATKVRDSEIDKGVAIFLDMTKKVAESFLQNSFLMSSNENKSIADEVKQGNYAKAKNMIENNAINYIGSYMLWSGFANQSLQGGRYLSGDKSYQEAKTLSEKVQKQMGLAGISYSNTKPNYMGRPLEATEVNREGIQGFFAMFSKDSKPKIEKWVEDIGFKETLAGRKSKQLAAIEEESFVAPTVEQYDKFTDEVRQITGKAIEYAYNNEKKLNIPLVNQKLKENKKTGKPYTKEEYTNEVLNDMSNAIEGYKRTELVNTLDKNKFTEKEYKEKLDDYKNKLLKSVKEFTSIGDKVTANENDVAKSRTEELLK